MITSEHYYVGTEKGYCIYMNHEPDPQGYHAPALPEAGTWTSLDQMRQRIREALNKNHRAHQARRALLFYCSGCGLKMATEKGYLCPTCARNAIDDANRKMFGDETAELIDLGILPDNIGNK